MDAPLRMRRENWGSSSAVAGPSVFLSSADGDVGELVELPQGCQGPFLGSGRKLGFLLRHSSRKGPQLAFKGESPRLWRGSSQIMMENSGTRSWGLREIHDPRVSRGAPWDFSAVTARAEVLIWSLRREIMVPLQSRHGSWGFSVESTGE